ncbi:MAG: hypothetical protein ACOZIN_11795 [Myxococcota bacterium]
MVFFLASMASGAMLGYVVGTTRAQLRDSTDRSAQPAGSRLRRRPFRVSQPPGWTLDKNDPHVEPERALKLLGPEVAIFHVEVLKGLADAAKIVETNVEGFSSGYSSPPRRTPFTQWGSYQGVGAILDGTGTSGYPLRSRVFAHVVGGKGFAVYETRGQSTKDDHGLQMIESSFELLP